MDRKKPFILCNDSPIELSHEQKVMKALEENEFLNHLLICPKLSLKAKQTISKEIKSYV